MVLSCQYAIILQIIHVVTGPVNIYSLTGGGRDIFTGTGENRRCQGSYTPLREMDSRDGIKGVLNRAAFNCFMSAACHIMQNIIFIPCGQCGDRRQADDPLR